jgi:hypothetical protein
MILRGNSERVRWTGKIPEDGRKTSRKPFLSVYLSFLSAPRKMDFVLSGEYDRESRKEISDCHIKETPMIRIYLYERPLGVADFLKERGLEGDIEKGPAGKPFLPGSGHYFNKSDSGAFTAFALSDEGEVGLDLQKILPYKDRYLRLSERFFCPEEKDALLSLKEEERGDYFFRLWTVKESYLKFTGKGLGGGLDSFGADLGSGRILPGRDQDPPAVFRILEGPGGYALSVCASSLPEHIEIIREA